MSYQLAYWLKQQLVNYSEQLKKEGRHVMTYSAVDTTEADIYCIDVSLYSCCVNIILYEDIATVVVGKNQMGQLQFDEWESKENKYIGMIREIEKYIKKEEQKL